MSIRTRIANTITTARAKLDAVRTTLRRELGTPEQIKQDIRRLASKVGEVFEAEEPGGPQYDEDDEVIYPPGARVLYDAAKDPNSPWNRYR